MRDIGQRCVEGCAGVRAEPGGRASTVQQLIGLRHVRASFVLRNREYYACASHWNGNACKNDIKVPRVLVQQILLAGIREDLADPAVIEEVERRVRAATRQQRQPKADHGKRIGQLTREVSNLTDAIWRSATGDSVLELRGCYAPPTAFSLGQQEHRSDICASLCRTRICSNAIALDAYRKPLSNLVAAARFRYFPLRAGCR